MFRVALIHTVPTVYSSFGDRIKRVIPDVKIINTVDEYLAADPAERGEFTIENRNRLLSILKCAEITEPDAIVATCSTLSPEIEKLRCLIRVPIITIDEAMIKTAAQLGSKITILATADSTLGPTKTKLIKEAQRIGKDIEVSIIVSPEAYIAIKARDQKRHDELVCKSALEIKQQDVIILAQASMAHLEEEIQKICGCAVLSSPRMCIEQLKKYLYGKLSSK